MDENENKSNKKRKMKPIAKKIAWPATILGMIIPAFIGLEWYHCIIFGLSAWAIFVYIIPLFGMIAVAFLPIMGYFGNGWLGLIVGIISSFILYLIINAFYGKEHTTDVLLVTCDAANKTVDGALDTLSEIDKMHKNAPTKRVVKDTGYYVNKDSGEVRHYSSGEDAPFSGTWYKVEKD